MMTRKTLSKMAIKNIMTSSIGWKMQSKRPGRPKVHESIKKRRVGYRLAPWLIKYIQGQDRTASDVIEQAVVFHNNIDVERELNKQNTKSINYSETQRA